MPRNGGNHALVDAPAVPPVQRPLRIPPGVSNGQSLWCPADVIDGRTLPAVEFIVVVGQPAQSPPPEPTPSMDDLLTALLNARRRDPQPPGDGEDLLARFPGPHRGGRRPTRRASGRWAAGGSGSSAVALCAFIGWLVFAWEGDAGELEAEGGPSPVVVESPGSPTPSVSIGSAEPSPATPDASSRLWTLAEESKATVRSWPVGFWVPQLSAQCEGMQAVDFQDADERVGFPDGQAESFPQGIDATQMLAFHDAGARWPNRARRCRGARAHSG